MIILTSQMFEGISLYHQGYPGSRTPTPKKILRSSPYIVVQLVQTMQLYTYYILLYNIRKFSVVVTHRNT